MNLMKTTIDNIELSTSVISVNETSDPNIKTVTMLVHKCDIPNGNGLDFKLDQTELYMNTLIDKPVVTKYYEYKDDLGTHEAVFDENGRITELKTIAIGTITEVWIDDYELEDGTSVKALFAKATLWSYKYPKIISCIEKLFEDGNAESSVEVAIYEWAENPTQLYRYATSYAYLANCLLGSDIEPADNDAGVVSISQKEISKAVWEDTQVSEESIVVEKVIQKTTTFNEKENKKGGQTIVSEKEEKKIEVAENKGYKVAYRGMLEACDLTFDQIRGYIYNLLNPLDSVSGYRIYNYYITEIYPNYVVAVDWDYDNVAYRIGYTVSGDIASLVPKDQWIKGRIGFIPDGVTNDDLLEELTEDETDDAKIDLATKVAELEATVVDLQTQLSTSNTQVEELTAQLTTATTELNQFKEEKELAEKKQMQTGLSSKYSKLMSKEVFASERVKSAIDNIDENELKTIVVEELSSKDVTNVKQEETVVVNAKEQGDLLPTSKYDYLFKSKQD